jgi:hypothetical protein
MYIYNVTKINSASFTVTVTFLIYKPHCKYATIGNVEFTVYLYFSLEW